MGIEEASLKPLTLLEKLGVVAFETLLPEADTVL